MSNVPIRTVDPARERDVRVVALVVALIHARRKGDFVGAAQAHIELVDLGVLVRFPRKSKGVDRE